MCYGESFLMGSEGQEGMLHDGITPFLTHH
jgi:hypothetical protein